MSPSPTANNAVTAWKKPTSVCFVSDLHLFAERSRGEQYRPALVTAARRSQWCVLGGDIFDFRWSTLPSLRATLEAARDWLNQLVKDAPNTRFHLVLGNHDDHPLFRSELPTVCEATDGQFEWSRYLWRLGDAVFLHGDVADRRMSDLHLRERRDTTRHDQPGKLQHGAYRWVVRTGLHEIIPVVRYSRRRVASRISHYLRAMKCGPEAGVRQVCFGHTHRDLDEYHYKGLVFHNGGAPIGPPTPSGRTPREPLGRGLMRLLRGGHDSAPRPRVRAERFRIVEISVTQ